MNSIKALMILPAILLAAGFTSCKKKGCTDSTATNYSTDAKKDDGSCVYDSYTADFAAFYKANRDAATQTFSINPTIFNEIVGTGGTKLQIPANSFVDGGGTPITATVSIKMLEVLDQTDMFLLNATTSSANEILESGGSVNVTASSGGSEVFLASGSSIGLFVPYTAADPAMGIFDGAEDATTGDVSWTDESTVAVTVPDTSGGWTGYYYYDWQDSDLGWINCDFFWDNPNPKSGLKINVPNPYGWDNTELVLHFSDIASVAPVYTLSMDPGEDTYYAYNIPSGSEITVIAIAEIDGTYYSSFTPITMTLDMETDISLSATTLAAIEAAVDAL